MNISDKNAGGHFAHFGGMIFGFLYIRYTQGKLKIPSINLGRSSNTKKPKFKVTVNKDFKVVQDTKDTVSQKEIDAILDKISRSGYNSLSKKEKELLFKASKK